MGIRVLKQKLNQKDKTNRDKNGLWVFKGIVSQDLWGLQIIESIEYTEYTFLSIKKYLKFFIFDDCALITYKEGFCKFSNFRFFGIELLKIYRNKSIA